MQGNVFIFFPVASREKKRKEYNVHVFFHLVNMFVDNPHLLFQILVQMLDQILIRCYCQQNSALGQVRWLTASGHIE